MASDLPGGPSPLHRALAQDILRRLRARGLGTGEKLSRLKLAQELGVSRTPVAGAVALLERHGVVATEGRAVRLLRTDLDPAALDGGPDAVATLLVALARDRRAGTLPEEVSERQLQARYGAGRQVVAAALRQLAELGAAMRNRGHGWRILAGFMTAEERQASYRFRMVVEPAALLEPGFALPPGWATEMRARHQAFLERPWRLMDPVAFFETNAAFHLGLAEASGNRFFVQAVEQQNRLRRFNNYDWQSGEERVRVSAAEHLGILEAVEAGRREEAAERMHRHLAGTALLPWRPGRA